MTGIQWTERTWNPIVGCSVVSPGCTNCYAMKFANRLLDKPGSHYERTTKVVNRKAVWTGRVGLAPDRILSAPVKRKKPTLYFVNSMGDVFHEDVPDAWIDRVFAVMALCPQHTFQVLTKRGDRMRGYMLERWQPAAARQINFPDGRVINIPAETKGATRRCQVSEACEWIIDALDLADTENDDLWTAEGSLKIKQFSWPLPNVWLGVSVEDQRRAEERLPDLLETPAAVRFVSAEPLLAPVDLMDIRWPDNRPKFPETDDISDSRSALHFVEGTRLDWVIVGGESGPGARTMELEWARAIVRQCKANGVPVFVKQLGAKPVSGGVPLRLRDRKGGDMSAWPADLRVRDMPQRKESTAKTRRHEGALSA